MNVELIKERIAEHQKNLDIWNEQLKKIMDGTAPNLPPFNDLVTRHVSMYGHQIAELKWVIENAL
jgi:hypothetical protein